MKRTATFLVILASLLAALLAVGAVSNQAKIVQLIEDETAEIQCAGKKLAIRRMGRTQVVAWCVPADMPTPTQAPTDRPMPTDMRFPLIGGETAEIQCVGKKLAIRRISRTQVVACCVPADMPTPTQAPTDTPALTSTPTETPVPTETPTSTPTETPVPTKTATNTPTPTATGAPTSTPTETPVPTMTATNTPTPTDMPVPPTSERVPRYGLFEMPLPFGEYPHPYYSYDPADTSQADPGRLSPYGADGVTVDAHFTAPSGKVMIVPCFWDGTRWALRASFDETGTWQWFATAEDKSGVVRHPESGALSVEVAAWDNAGFIRINPQDSRWFAFDSGEPFIPLSAGSLQFPVPPYSQPHVDKIREAAAAGANFARVWLNNYGYGWTVEAPPEGNPPPDPYSVTYGTHVNLAGAQQIDEIVMAAQESGVYLQLCDVSSAEWNWDYSTSADPWVPNRVPPNDPRYVAYWKRNFRYKVARWGWATSVMAWEHWNELGHVDPGSNWWGFYEAYIPYQRAMDPYGHLVTTSQNVQAYSPAMWSQLTDVANVHEGMWQRDKPELYGQDMVLAYRVAQYLRREGIDCQQPNGLNYKSCSSWTGPDKPWIWGEHMAITTDEAYKGNGGVDTRSLSGVSGKRFAHNRGLIGAFYPVLGIPVPWFEWATDADVREANRQAVQFVRDYLTDFDPVGVSFAATSNLAQPNYTGPTIQASDPRLYVMSVYWPQGANVWVSSEDLNWLGPENPTPASGTFELIGLSPGHYRLTWFNTWTGETTDGGTLTSIDGTLPVSVDDLVQDVALKVRAAPAGPTATPGPTHTSTPTATQSPVVTPTGTPVPQPGGWNQLGGNERRTNYSPDDLDELELLWWWNGPCSDGSDCRPGDPDIGWSFYAPPDAYAVAGGGNLYLPSYEGLWAVSQKTGRTAWRHRDIFSLVSGAYHDGFLYIAGEHGAIYKINAATGEAQIVFNTPADITVAPALTRGRLYVASDAALYALDLDGNLIWKYDAGSLVTTPASVADNRIVFGLRDLRIVALDLGGNLAWERNPAQRQPGWDPIYDMPVSYYDHGWIVVADGKAFVKVHVPKRISYQPPGGNYPATSAEVRTYLAQHPEQQTLFALNLDNGSDAYGMPLPIGPIGTEIAGTTERGWTLGPMMAVDEELNVAWIPWRAAGNNQTQDQWKFSREGGVCELNLETGDCRYVNFYGQPGLGIIIDGAGGTIAASPERFHYPHWMYVSSWLVTDRTGDGQSWDTRVQTQREMFALNRVESQAGYNCVFNEDLWCPNGMDAFCDGAYFSGGGHGIFWDVTDPPYACSSAYSDGYMPRQVIVDSGRLYYQLNGSTIIAFGRSE